MRSGRSSRPLVERPRWPARWHWVDPPRGPRTPHPGRRKRGPRPAHIHTGTCRGDRRGSGSTDRSHWRHRWVRVGQSRRAIPPESSYQRADDSRCDLGADHVQCHLSAEEIDTYISCGEVAVWSSPKALDHGLRELNNSGLPDGLPRAGADGA